MSIHATTTTTLGALAAAIERIERDLVRVLSTHPRATRKTDMDTTPDDRDADALDAALSDILWRAQLEPSTTPRIVHERLVNRDYSYLLPGSMWPDGRARVIVNPRTFVDIPAVLRQLRTQDAPHPGAEPPALTGGAPCSE